MNLIFLWWLTLGALIGFAAEWLWDWAWFRARRQVVSSQVDTSISKLQGERDRLAADLKVCGDRRVTLEGDLATARAGLDDVDAYRVRVSELEPLVGQVASLKAENARLQADLEAARAGAVELAPAGVTLGASADTTLAARAVGGADEGELASLRTYNLSMHDELEASRRALSRFAAGKGDPLIDIDGIGPVFQQRLYDAGVVSFEQLASMHPERLRSLVASNAAFELRTEGWVDEARRFAKLPARDPLIDIDGIGPVYEQRLLNAGVSSFAQLAAMTPEEIRAVIKPEAWQLIEPEAWIAEATAFAQQVRDGAYRKGRY
jgi:predicted flap endonuclease-1-like 5' DNA nuclease